MSKIKGINMSELSRMKKENKRLTKQFKEENRTLLRDIDYYFNDFYIPKSEKIRIMNKILNDFNIRLKVEKLLWNSIVNPRMYCDEYLLNYEKKDTSFLGLIKENTAFFILLFCLVYLINDFQTSNVQSLLDPSLVEITSTSLLKNLSYFVFFFILLISGREKIFVRYKSINSKPIIFYMLYLFSSMFIIGMIEEWFVLIIPKVILYLGVIVSLLFIYYKPNFKFFK